MPFEYQSVYFDNHPIQQRILDIFIGNRVTKKVAIFFIHGGGWRSGTRVVFHTLMREFNNQGFICASTDYRLSDVDIFDQYVDVYQGYNLFRSKIKAIKGIDKVFVIGSSAGAHLGLLLCMLNPYKVDQLVTHSDFINQQSQLEPPVGGAFQAAPVTFEPWENMFPPIWERMQNIVGQPFQKAPSMYKQISPIELINKKTVPIFLLEAANEHMFPIENSHKFITKMKELGRQAKMKIYNNSEHGFFYDVSRSSQKEAFQDILDFIESLSL